MCKLTLWMACLVLHETCLNGRERRWPTKTSDVSAPAPGLLGSLGSLGIIISILNLGGGVCYLGPVLDSDRCCEKARTAIAIWFLLMIHHTQSAPCVTIGARRADPIAGNGCASAFVLAMSRVFSAWVLKASSTTVLRSNNNNNDVQEKHHLWSVDRFTHGYTNLGRILVPSYAKRVRGSPAPRSVSQ